MEHKEGTFKRQKNLNLYYQCWLPSGEPKAILLVVNGLAEHSGRYQNLVDYFVPKGYAVYSYDHRGHGRSEGARCYVERFSEYVDDLKSFFDIVRGEHKEAKVFLIGHSMGGTIATAYAIRYQQDLAGLLLSAATLKVGSTASPVLITMAGILSALLPKMGTIILDAPAISRDRAVVDAYVNDPLVYRGKIPARMAPSWLRLYRNCHRKCQRLLCPC